MGNTLKVVPMLGDFAVASVGGREYQVTLPYIEIPKEDAFELMARNVVTLCRMEGDKKLNQIDSKVLREEVNKRRRVARPSVYQADTPNLDPVSGLASAIQIISDQKRLIDEQGSRLVKLENDIKELKRGE